MKCIIHVFQLNDLYSQRLADEKFGGKESEDNRKFLWEDEFAVTKGFRSVEVKRNEVFSLEGIMPDQTSFNYPIAKCCLFVLSSDGFGDTELAVSESILHDFTMGQKEGDTVLKIYIKDNEPYANPIHGIYIASKEFPKELQ
jgi:hypothetical protein